jgi:SCY1-like protein 1
MDFLRNIASAALQSTGVTFPFVIGDRVQGIPSNSIWDVREGVKKVITHRD